MKEQDFAFELGLTKSGDWPANGILELGVFNEVLIEESPENDEEDAKKNRLIGRVAQNAKVPGEFIAENPKTKACVNDQKIGKAIPDLFD